MTKLLLNWLVYLVKKLFFCTDKSYGEVAIMGQGELIVEIQANYIGCARAYFIDEKICIPCEPDEEDIVYCLIEGRTLKICWDVNSIRTVEWFAEY